MIFQLSLFATLSIVLLFSSQCASQVTLMQKSTEVNLDASNSMELVCSVTGSISSTRGWTGGPGFLPLITNGVSTDSSKYTETVQTADFSLHIHNVIVDDVCDIDYKCSNGFFDSTETIVLNSSIFRHVPKPSEIQVQNEVYDNNMKMTILVNLTTVFPEPTCKAELENTDITSKLLTNSYNNGNCGLKFTELSIINETYQCSDTLVISCIVGSYTVMVYTGGPSCPISEMSTVIATGRMTSVNSISEFSNTTLSMISGSTTTTSIGTSIFYAKTQIDEIQTNTLKNISNYMSTYQSMFTTTTDISRSFKIPIQIMTETFTMTGYTISSYNEIISPSTFETITVFPQIVSKTSISLSLDTHSDSLLHTTRVSSGSLIITDSSKYSILSMTISPSYVGDSNIPSLSNLFSVPSLTSDATDSAFEITNVSRVSNFSMTNETVITPITTATVDSCAVNTVLNSTKSESLQLSISENNSRIQHIETNTEFPLISTTFIDQISYSSKIEELSFSSYQDFSEISVTLSEISVSSQLSSSIIDTIDNFIYTTNTLITSYLDDTRLSFVNFTSVVQPLSLDYAVSSSTFLPYFIQSKYHDSSLQTTEYHATIKTEFTSYVTTSIDESNTDNTATGIYSKRKVTSAHPYRYTSSMPSQTQFASMNDIQDSTTHFQSTYLDPYFETTDVVFSSKIYEYALSTWQSTNFFNTDGSAFTVHSSMKTTNKMIFETQSGMLTISTVVSDFETTRLTTSIDFSNETMLSMIKPSSQQKNTEKSYIEINTSFKDSLFSASRFCESLTANYLGLTTLSSTVFESMSTAPTSTVHSGLSEKNKIIIFISTTSAVVTIIVVIILIVFAKMNMSKHIAKPRNEDDDISWSNSGSPSKTVCPDYSFTGKSIYPFVNTSSSSFKMYPYEHNWNEIV